GQPLDRFPVSPSPCTMAALGHPWPTRHLHIHVHWTRTGTLLQKRDFDMSAGLEIH
ncbi:MAG: hypothetical protein ACI9CB_002859, partial [Rhodothermales bacterium]